MRKTSLVVLASLAGSIVVFACSSSSPGGGVTNEPDSGTHVDSGTSPGTQDTGTVMNAPDTGSGSGSSSGSGSGSSSGSGSGSSSGSGSGSSSGSGSGSGADSGADAGFVCDAPAQCPGATPVCCARIPITGGSIPNCTNGTVTVDCETQTACESNVAFACTAGSTEVVNLCQTAADCANEPNGYTECCMFGSANEPGTLSFCATSLIALGASSCMQ